MSNNKVVKWGILGSGRIAADLATNLNYFPNAQLVAVGARSKQSAEEFAKKFNIPQSYGSYEELVKDPEIDIIYVSTVHPQHKNSCLLALNNGKHVLCEKPLTMNVGLIFCAAKEAQEVIDLARSKKLFCMEAMWTRYFPAIVKVRELVQSGALGEIKLFQGNFGFKNTGTARIVEPELGGGALLDIGVYPISFASMIFGPGEPSKVIALGHIGPSNVDEVLSIMLGYKQDQIANIVCSIVADCPKEIDVIGTNGRIRIHRPFWCPSKITVTLNKGGKEFEDTTYDFPLPEVKPGHSYNFTNSEGMRYEIAYVHSMLAEGRTESAVETLEESLTIMKIMDEIRKQIGLAYSADK